MAVTRGRVADAAHDCIASFDAIAQIYLPASESSTILPEWSRHEDGRSRFQIWMSNLGAAHPAADRRSADHRLREAPEVVDRIVELLEELTEINSEVLEIVSGERSNRHIVEEDSDTEISGPDSGQDELSELFLSTGDVLTSLFKVSMLVKKATTRDRYARAASAKDKPYLIEFDIRHVADKYPKVREQPWLLERLGTAITQRRQYLRYCRNHKNRIAHVTSSDTAVLGKDEDAPKFLYQDNKLGLPAKTTHVASSTKTPMTRPTLSPTTASTLQPDRLVREDLHDLDDRDDALSQSTSVAYSQPDEEGSGHLRVVRLQDLSHNNEPFECPYCFSIVQARRQRSWRKHVLSDLRAYVCMFEDCDAGLFEDKAAWAQHDAEEHRRQWDCQHCRDKCGPFSSPRSLQEHMRTLHAGDELPTQVLSQVVEASSRPLTETVPDCPLCDFETQVHSQADRLGRVVPLGSQAVIPLAELQKHLALHQEQLALFSIPPTVERGVESESRHGKSQVGPDEQIKMMADWQDHLSELDAADGEQPSDSETNIESAEESREGHPGPLPQAHSNIQPPIELPKIDRSLYRTQEGESPSFLPGDIVYISRLTGEQLLYTKAVYLGTSANGTHTACDWNTRDEVEVSLSELVRKVSITEEERAEAESLLSQIATQDTEDPPESADYLKDVTVPLGVMSTLIMRASKLANRSEWLSGYDRATVRTTFSAFVREYGAQALDRSLRVEDVVQMFYASAMSDVAKDKTSSDNVRTAYVERHAALLTDVLVGIIDRVSERYFPDRDIVSAQLREEQAEMMSRANQAIRDSKEETPATSGEHAGSTREERLKEAELSPQLVEALKSRLALVIKGEETSVTLPKFGAHLMTQTCSSFLSKLPSMFIRDQPVPLEVVMSVFHVCAKTVIRQDRAASNNESRSVSAERLVALLLSLLISIEADLQLERSNSILPRILNGFTAVLMEERSRKLSQASEIEERLFRVSRRSKPKFDIHFFTEESRRAHDKRYGELIAGGEKEPSDLDDPAEPKYCYCLRGAHGVMVACDGPNCSRKWFHLTCTDLEKPLDKYKTWFCVFCQPPVSSAAEDTGDATAADIAEAGDADQELKETQEADTTAKERPPRGMVCDNCKFVWRSALAMELRDCPNCGSYSVFAESPPRTTSPEGVDAALRPDATGGEAIGQYFSERTDKFMSLYRREQPAKSRPEPSRDKSPDPESHLGVSPSTKLHRLDKSPPALPSDPPPDIDVTADSAGDEIKSVVKSGSSTIPQLRRMLKQIEWAQFSSYGTYGRFTGELMGFSELGDAKDQLSSLGAMLGRLLRDESDHGEHMSKLQSLGSVVSDLCFSVQITLEDVLIAITSKRMRQWRGMIRMMEKIELVGLWERLKLYHDLIEGLFDVTEGLESDGYLKVLGADVRRLLMSQKSNSLYAALIDNDRREILGPDFGRQDLRSTGSLAKETPQPYPRDPAD